MSTVAREPRLLKISALAKQSGVPAATVKHYLREGLLPEAAKRTGRNMAYYDPSCIERIRTIKRLQQERFLPLKVIKEVLDSVGDEADDLTTAAAISRVLAGSAEPEVKTRAELMALGVEAAELDLLRSIGLVTPEGRDERYSGDDLALLRLLGQARKAGLATEMLPTGILADYVKCIRALVRTELELFRAGVLPLAGDRLADLTENATQLSEQLVVLVRRKLLLPTLSQLVREAGVKKPVRARPRVAPARARRRAKR
jgi:DNA-binding transcriptional MerR regulator